ncbi:MAG TPA: lytic transglycosylase domain-containing protein [Syntrophorhabdales bacterium]|nr:lytic transglycosylase domain-containing protein [Syntrophorhabdales bacterium]
MKPSRKVLLVLTSAAMIPALIVTATHTVKHVQAPDSHDDNTIENIVGYLQERMPDVSEERLREIATHVYAESKKHGLDYRLVLAVMKVESNFKENAVSSKGARGLLQIKPSLGRDIAETLGVNWSSDRILHEPEKNIKFGVYQLSQLIENFETLSWALYAYNSGQTKARELATKRQKPSLRFAKAVLSEYEKTVSVLPEAQ